MTQEDIHALDHMEAYAEQRALFGGVSTDMGKSRVIFIEHLKRGLNCL